MKVIIVKPTKKIKKIGEVVQVKKGYARNYLFPRGIAIKATDENRVKFEELKKDLDLKNKSLRQEAEKIMSKVKDTIVTFIVQSLEDGKLFGSIAAKQIAKELSKEQNIEVKADQINLESPIKSIGVYAVEVALHHDVLDKILVNVARTDSEALSQLANFKNSIEEVAKEEAIKTQTTQITEVL